MRRLIFCLAALFALLSLSACGAPSVWASDKSVQEAAYVHDGPPMVTLFTVISKQSGNGAHSGLLINGSQRVMFDPAGTWQHPKLPERNDLHYGITPKMEAFYIDYHARETYDVIKQDIVVSPGSGGIDDAAGHGLWRSVQGALHQFGFLDHAGGSGVRTPAADMVPRQTDGRLRQDAGRHHPHHHR